MSIRFRICTIPLVLAGALAAAAYAENVTTIEIGDTVVRITNTSASLVTARLL